MTRTSLSLVWCCVVLCVTDRARFGDREIPTPLVPTCHCFCTAKSCFVFRHWACPSDCPTTTNAHTHTHTRAGGRVFGLAAESAPRSSKHSQSCV